MSRHAAPEQAAEDSELVAALRAALARRQAAELSGQAPRRRRGADDATQVGAPHEPVSLGWPESGDGAVAERQAPPSPLGWPAEPPVKQPVAPAAEQRVATPAGQRIEPPVEAPKYRPVAELAPSDPPATVDPPAPAWPAPKPAGAGRATRPAPGSGWRRILYTASGKLINPGESALERRRRALTEQLAGSTPGCYRIAVISLKGGVGKTTMSVCLGAVLASTRPDRVIAVDANPDRGTLAGKVAPQTAATIRDLLEALPRIGSYADVRAFTSQTPDRLEVLASAADPALSQAFDEQDYRRVVGALEDYYNVVVTDCGTGLLHSAMSGVLELADQLVVIATNSVDGANSASATLDWLQAHGHADLVSGSVAVINAVVPGSGRVDQERLAAHFVSRCRAVVRIPHDAHLEAGAEVELAALGQPTRDALLDLAAAVVVAIPST